MYPGYYWEGLGGYQEVPGTLPCTRDPAMYPGPYLALPGPTWPCTGPIWPYLALYWSYMALFDLNMTKYDHI